MRGGGGGLRAGSGHGVWGIRMGSAHMGALHGGRAGSAPSPPVVQAAPGPHRPPPDPHRPRPGAVGAGSGPAAPPGPRRPLRIWAGSSGPTAPSGRFQPRLRSAPLRPVPSRPGRSRPVPPPPHGAPRAGLTERQPPGSGPRRGTATAPPARRGASSPGCGSCPRSTARDPPPGPAARGWSPAEPPPHLAPPSRGGRPRPLPGLGTLGAPAPPPAPGWPPVPRAGGAALPRAPRLSWP